MVKVNALNIGTLSVYKTANVIDRVVIHQGLFMSMQDAIDSVSINKFHIEGIVRVPFPTSVINSNRNKIIKAFEVRGFKGELRIGGGFDGNGNEHVLYDLNKMEPTEAFQWVKDHSHETE